MSFTTFFGYVLAIGIIILLWEFVKSIFKNTRKFIRDKRFRKSMMKRKKKEFPAYQSEIDRPAQQEGFSEIKEGSFK